MIPSLLKNLVSARTDHAEPADAPLLFLQRQGALARVLPRSEHGLIRARRPRKKRSHARRQLQLPL